eukprot:CAMPEP_0194332136 /NCGR_PEP_ID=MMETSP0171-20130528/58176_1 /TAXON_ID=218684 /ORGANISM="Corethron pennatum, Strain L29A3" /LENGTH=332 /DNA_ID=CAMNT_0039093869 /DNA_START=71 /DNA_END=1069 /DNA_ORIENTATION=+
MKAAVRTGLLGYGGCSVSEVQPAPILSGSDSVMVRVLAAAINPVDYKLPRLGAGAVYGLDFCGVVAGVGGDVADFKEGDRVFGRASSGSLAEYATASAGNLALAPSEFVSGGSGWSDAECAALPTAYLTALQGLRTGGITNADAVPGGNSQSVLIIGASGGCGTAAVQLAAAMGVPRIVGICSGRNAAAVRAAGATEVLDYTDGDALAAFWGTEGGRMDCVYDAATGSGDGENYFEGAGRTVREDPPGMYVTLNGPASTWLRKVAGWEKKGRRLIVTKGSRDDLNEIVSLLEGTGVRPVVTVYPFTERGVEDGFGLLKSRRARGKLVFDVKG